MKVRKGNILRNKYDPYYIELGNTYSLLAEFSSNPIQADKSTGTDIQFKINSTMRRHKKKNKKINKYIIANKDNDGIIIDAAIKLA